MSEIGPATRALLASIPRRRGDWPERDSAELARRICGACVYGLDIDGAAVSIVTDSDSRETVWASDATANHLEELQFTLNEGACIQAATTGRPVLVADLTDSVDAARWPVFAASVLEQTPARALFALPLQWGVTGLGVLDLYRATPGALGAAQWRDAQHVAELGTVLMLDVLTEPGRLAGMTDGSEWLDPPSGNHAQVHQAVGMVLAQLGVSSTEALARLRAHAFTHDRLLVDVARDVVNRRLGLTDDDNAGSEDPDGGPGGEATGRDISE